MGVSIEITELVILPVKQTVLGHKNVSKIQIELYDGRPTRNDIDRVLDEMPDYPSTREFDGNYLKSLLEKCEDEDFKNVAKKLNDDTYCNVMVY